MVPTNLRTEVYLTISARSSEIDSTWGPWWKAAHRAIAHVALTEGHFTVAQEARFIMGHDKIAMEDFVD